MIYIAPRVGQGGKIFNQVKIRTMVPDADRLGGSSTADTDPRITPVGRFLRKTKLDELPQFYNILKGEMTLIGWRPEHPEYLDTLSPEILATKPGLIGLATLWDIDEGERLAGEADPDKTYREEILPIKRKLEYNYIKYKSIRLNLWICRQTIKKLLLKLAGKSSRQYTAPELLTFLPTFQSSILPPSFTRILKKVMK